MDAEIIVHETEESIVVSTAYTSEDFIEYEFNMGGENPDVEFEEVRKISKEEGLLTYSERTYSFKINSPDTMNVDLNLSQSKNDDDGDSGEELMGKIFVEMSSELSLEGFNFGAASVFVDAPEATEAIEL